MTKQQDEQRQKSHHYEQSDTKEVKAEQCLFQLYQQGQKTLIFIL
jgi:hypothetical protein